MSTTFAFKVRRSVIIGVFWGAIVTGCVGCQTFSLSDEDFQNQQRGETVDGEAGAVVGVVGTAGYIGAVVGEAVAEAVKK